MFFLNYFVSDDVLISAEPVTCFVNPLLLTDVSDCTHLKRKQREVIASSNLRKLANGLSQRIEYITLFVECVTSQSFLI